MKYPLYSIRDNKATSFSPPVVQVNEAVMRRDFEYRLHNDRAMGFAPSDYELYQIGNFDVDTGVLEPFPIPEFIVSGGEMI